MNEFKQLSHNKGFKSNVLKEIAEEDEHLPINIEIEKKNTTRAGPK